MAATTARAADAWWRRPLAELQRELDTDGGGLTDEESVQRLKRYGRNTFRKDRARPLLLEFLWRFRNPLVLILLAASAVSAVTGQTASSVIVLLLVLFSVTLDFVQERRAARAAAALRESVAVRARVVRQGTEREIDVALVVPGDVVLVSAGDLIPADARVLEARDFFLRQALLTGEPYPIEKRAVDTPQAQDLADATGTVYMGTSVISGSARLLVARTGEVSAMGAIAGELDTTPPPTSFEVGVRRFGFLIMRMTLLLVLFALLANALLGRPWLESFMFAVALAVGLTPELLPMVMSVTLAHGARRMAAKRVVVKRLSAIEDLGSMDVLCTDKTGTLTEGKIRLEQHEDALGRESERVLELAYINSAFETGLKSPLDEAILAHSHIDISRFRKIDEVPFDFERRRVSVLAESGQDGLGRILVVKGAPEDIMALCIDYEDGDRRLALEEPTRERLTRRLDELGDQGFRVLGIAWKAVPEDHPHAVVDDESALTFCGFAGFLDPQKDSAAEALAQLAQAGVQVKVVTGDNEHVTRYICARLGVPVVAALTGADIARLDDAGLQAVAEQTTLFCRVNPSQKNRIILALKGRGHVVGYLGDGVNDAPPLHSSDVGLSVESAVDVAREAADMILLDSDLRILHEGVKEGRRTYANIMKYIMMGTSSNFGNMFSMAGATLFLPFLPMLPVQILLNNMLYDISEVPIPTDRVDTEEIEHPRNWDMRFIRDFMWGVGPVSSLFDFLMFFILLKVFEANQALFQTGWFIESLATQVLVIFVIRTRASPFASRPAPLLVATSLTVVAAAALVPWTPLGSYFGFVPPPLAFYGVVAAMVASYLVLVQWVKRRFYQLHPAA